MKIEKIKRKSLIYCTLHQISLDATPLFKALSYTWLLDKDLKKQTVQGKERAIICDGRYFLVRENLFNAMIELGETQLGGLLWIDAICINQNDVMEQSSQVNMMGRIFQAAETVVVWLGQSSFISSRGLEAMRTLYELSHKQINDGTQAQIMKTDHVLQLIH